MENKQRLEIKVKPDQMAWLREESDARECSIGELIRVAIDKERSAAEESARRRSSADAPRREVRGEGEKL